jgi:hypothetical protein
MKTAYELAMERLGQASPPVRLSAEQKKALAEQESLFRSKIAEREIALNGEAAAAQEKGDYEAAEKARERLTSERRKLQAELEERKERIRQEAKSGESK